MTDTNEVPASPADVAPAPTNRKARAKLLTDSAIADEKPGPMVRKVADALGLYLEIRPTGSKIWRYRYRLGDAEHTYTIGEYGKRADQVSLTQARELRAKAAALVKENTHPRAFKKDQLAAAVRLNRNTFRVVAEEWHAAKAKAGLASHYVGQLRTTLDVDILPAIGDSSLTRITSAQVAEILKAREETPAWARLVLSSIMGIFDYANVAQLCDVNPAYPLRNAISRKSTALVRKPKPKANAHITLSEVPEFLAAVEAAPVADPVAKIGVRILMLTMLRPNEVTGAAWSEIDFDAALWAIPEGRMKMRRPHCVPLSRQAVALLRELRELTGDTPMLFPERNAKKRTGDDVAKLPNYFARFIRSIGFAGRLTAHGLRGTASTALNGARGPDKKRLFDTLAIEAQLAHARPGVAGKYDHEEYMADRVELLQAYADMVMPDGDSPARVEPVKRGNVVPLRKAA